MFRTADHMWHRVASDCMHIGSVAKDRGGGKTREMLFYAQTLMDPYFNIVTSSSRAMSIEYACAELLWYLGESDKVDMIAAYAPSYTRFAEASGRAHGHYGYRWHRDDSFHRYNNCEYKSQIDVAIRLLREQPDTRQCIINMWQAGDLLCAHQKIKKDLPCTLGFQCLLRDNKLHFITRMRSNDVWLGFPYDVFAFTSIQKLIADAVGADYGVYQHCAGSIHVYEKDWDKLHDVSPMNSDQYHAYDFDAVMQSQDQSRAPFDWRTQVSAAVQMERDVRTKREINVDSTRVLHPILRDAVCVCATKWKKDPALKDMITNPIIKDMVKC